MVSHECSYYAITTILGDRGDITLLGNDADICGAHPVLLGSFPGSVVAVIIHKVSASQLFKMIFGVIGLAILTLCQNMMAISVGANRCSTHAVEFLCFLHCQPLTDGLHISRLAKQCILRLAEV